MASSERLNVLESLPPVTSSINSPGLLLRCFPFQCLLQRFGMPMRTRTFIMEESLSFALTLTFAFHTINASMCGHQISVFFPKKETRLAQSWRRDFAFSTIAPAPAGPVSTPNIPCQQVFQTHQIFLTLHTSHHSILIQ